MDLYTEHLFQKFVPMIEDCRGKVRAAALSAIKHMELAERLETIDPNMAAFRAICAEEEAATSLICSLKALGYPESKFLRAHSHPHKQGVIFFITAIKNRYEEARKQSSGVLGNAVFVPTKMPGKNALMIKLPFQASGIAGWPCPPLNCYALPRDQPEQNGWINVINEEFSALVGEQGIGNVKEIIHHRANLRNTLLYANNESLPEPSFDVPTFIKNQAGIVHAILIVLGLVDPWRPPKYALSPIVSGALIVFEGMMRRVDSK